MLTLLLAAFLLARALPGSAKQDAARTDAPFGKFAGYAWQGHVASVQASWTVPTVAGGSQPGAAATWIGAQAHGDPASFIQIGTNEYRRKRPADENRYFTFWSDTTHHFRGQFLFTVTPGDSLSASLTLARKRWGLSIVDHSTGAKARFSTAQEADGAFDEAEWTQEDVSDAARGAEPYPQLTGVGFRRIAVNDSAPTYASVYSTWMSVNGGNWAPSPLHDDSFTLRQMRLTASGARYLSIVSPANVANQGLAELLERWTTKTPFSQIASDSTRFETALRRSDTALASVRWPQDVAGMVRALIRDTKGALPELRPPAVVSPATIAALRAQLTRPAPPRDHLGHMIRRALGAPELTPAA